MQTLGAYTGGRDNNFNLMRFVAAMMVIVSHSFVLATGDLHDEPWHTRLGITPGSLAVEIFFVASGYLVTASIYHRGNVLQFAIARGARIFPGLAVAVVSSTLLLGLVFSTLPFGEFISNRQTWSYLVRNIVLELPGGLSWSLPGVFDNHVSGNAVNGSLWTLVEEVRMYGLLALLWLGLRVLRVPPARWIGPVALGVAVIGYAWHFGSRGDETLTALPRLMALFFAGSTMYVWRDRIPASWALFGVLLAVTLLSALDRTAFGIVWLFTLPYLVLFLALVPGGPVREFNRFSDISYGLYIYAFPVQKAVVALWVGITPLALIGVSSLVTGLLAIASWRLVEHPALRLKDRFGPGARAGGVGLSRA
jgi:peptidoglycan/LPS O-acetylase OafA/YrhL